MVHARGQIHLGVSFTLVPIACIFVALRFYCRGVLVKNIGKDDWFMMVALLITVSMAIMNIFHIKHGTGYVGSRMR